MSSHSTRRFEPKSVQARTADWFQKVETIASMVYGGPNRDGHSPDLPDP